MKEYTVGWQIEVFADSPEDAARQAKRLQAAEDTTADVYEVGEVGSDADSVVLDLSRIDGRPV